MVKVIIAAKYFKTQFTVDGEWAISPIVKKIYKKTVKVATQNEAEGMQFSHWEVNGEKVSEVNPAVITLPSAKEVEILAIFK